MIKMLAPAEIYRNEVQLYEFENLTKNLRVTTFAVLPWVNLPEILLELWPK